MSSNNGITDKYFTEMATTPQEKKLINSKESVISEVFKIGVPIKKGLEIEI